MAQPTMTARAVTIAAARPRELARFYANLLSWEVTKEESARPSDPLEDGWAQVKPPTGSGGMTLNFEFDEHYQRPVWPSVRGRQSTSQHLDIEVEDLDAATAWAIEQGATLAEPQPQARVRVMIDPEGHPFCLSS